MRALPLFLLTLSLGAAAAAHAVALVHLGGAAAHAEDAVPEFPGTDALNGIASATDTEAATETAKTAPQTKPEPKPAAPAKAKLPGGLEEFLGPPPASFAARFLAPAKTLKAAQAIAKKSPASAIAKLRGLANGELAEHALFEIASLGRDKKDYAQSTADAERLLHLYPASVYSDRAQALIAANDCDHGLSAPRAEAVRLLERCLWRAPWKSWGGELEPQARALYEHLKAAKDPLLDPYLAELGQALPSGSALRARIHKEIPGDRLESLATLARYRTRNTPPAGVKPVNPDADLFDAGMKAVLKQDWSEANALFKRFPAEFPQSEHWERAQFWIARTEERRGHADEAKKRFEQILAENPFTYYGLQAALYLKRDWTPALTPAASPVAAKWEGALTSRQALSLWRLRALLLEGLIDYAREEAKTLAGAKANGAGIGQDDPKGALLMSRLFDASGNHLAAFSHAYAALSLDPGLTNRDSVSLIFPRPFADEFQEGADRSGVNSLLLVSVAKQESAFLPNAVSRADALGLLQLLPVTAREVLPGINRNDLFNPSQNVQAGGLYLYKLLDRYQGNIALALAAYNAGPGRASQWQKDLAETPLMKAGFDADAFIDSIPFAETRKYVGNILRNYAWYKMLAKEGPVTSVQELLFQWQKTTRKPPLASPPPETPATPATATP